MSTEDSTRPSGDEEGVGRPEKKWAGMAGLMVMALILPTAEPAVLVALPFVLFVISFPSRRFPAMAVAMVGALLVFGVQATAPLWYIDRGWALLVAGCFVALTLRWPGASFSGRALGSILGAGALVAGWLAFQPGTWGVLDWLVTERLRLGIGTTLEAIQLVTGGEQTISPAMVAYLYQGVDVQAQLFPALTALGSMAGLGVAWWLYVRLGHGDDRGLGPVREFRFNDQLVWIFIGGLLLMVLGLGEGPARAGSNAVVFMGALYALRGAAVFMFFSGGLSFVGFLLVILGLMLLPPVVVGGALLLGLGDTWLGLRERARELIA